MIAALAAPGAALLGEAPRWLTLGSPTPRLLFADLLTGTVFALDGDTSEVVAEFPGETVSALIPLRDGRTAVALRRAIAILDPDGAEVSRIELDLPHGTRLSDATAGPSGHVWLGVVAAGDDAAPGMLVRLEPNGFSVQRPDVGFSNGIAFTSDGSALVLVDSASNTVWSIRHDPATGELGEARQLFTLTVEEGALDGLCLDELDRAWVAVFGGGRVICVDTRGALVDRIDVPAPRVSSCAFGAERTLYITTARIDAPPDELDRYPVAGSLFRCELPVSGAPVWEGDLP